MPSTIKVPGLQKSAFTLLIIFLIIAGVILAKPFLVPVCFAGLFAMLFLPLCKRFENAGIARGISSFFCVLIFVLLIAAIIALLTWQVKNMADDLGNIEQKVTGLIDNVQNFITDKFGMSRQDQNEMMEKQSENTSGFITKIGETIMGTVVDFILVIVYIFLFLYFRVHIKKFIRKLVPVKDGENADDAIDKIEKVSQQYLTGLGTMIVGLWIMYSIGFSIVGLKNPIFFAILCGIFEIVPFVGNFVGNMLAAVMALTQGGGFPMVIGILICYSTIQFIQTYVLEPLVVGTEVNINPLFTIMGLVLGELLWGIPGMVLAIPLMGIIKIICDHVPALQPYGFLIGREKSNKPTLLERIKEKFKK